MNNTNSSLYSPVLYDRTNFNIPGYYYQNSDYYYTNYTWEYLDLSYAHTYIAGTIYIVLSAIQFLFYVRILTIIIFDKSLYELSAYKIIVQLGIADISYLLNAFASGFFMIFIIDYEDPIQFWIAKITGSISILGLLANPILTVLLAYNRFIQMIIAEYADEVFSRTITKIYIGMCWLLAAPLPILMSTPYIICQFQPIAGVWSINGKFSNSILLSHLIDYAEVLPFGSLVLSFVVYALIVGYLIYQKIQLIHVSHIVEIRLTIQMGIICFLGVFGNIWYWWIMPLLPNPQSFFNNMIYNIILLLYYGINPFVYLIFNKYNIFFKYNLQEDSTTIFTTNVLKNEPDRSCTAIRKSSYDNGWYGDLIKNVHWRQQSTIHNGIDNSTTVTSIYCTFLPFRTCKHTRATVTITAGVQLLYQHSVDNSFLFV